MKNRFESYKEIIKLRFNETRDKRQAQDLARADDDGFAAASTNSEVPLTNQDLDCWSDLWQRIKARFTRLFSISLGNKESK